MSNATAVRLTAFGLEHLALADVPVAPLGPRDVHVRLTAASLNYRDLMIARGHYNPNVALPRVLGSDAAGRVIAIGSEVTRFALNDRVSTLFFQNWLDGEITSETRATALGGDIDGAFLTERTFPEHGLIHTPAYLSDEEASTLPCAALTAWNGLVEKGRVAAGETVLVMGTGGVSLFALQIAKASGAHVILTSSSDEKLTRGRALGADQTINYRTTPDWAAEVHRLTSKRGVDHVVEVGGSGTLAQSLRAVRHAGRVYLIGVLAEPGKDVDVMPVLSKSIHLDGVYVGSRGMFTRMNAALAANTIRPVIDQVFPLAEARQAFEHLSSGTHFGKVVLRLE